MRISDWSSDVYSSDLCRGNVAPDFEIFRAGRLFPHNRTMPVLEVIAETGRQVGAPGRQCLAEHFRIGEQKIRRRYHVQQLPRGELHRRLTLPSDAPDAGGGAVPPFLAEQDVLVDEIERPVLPGRSEERRVGKGCVSTCRY